MGDKADYEHCMAVYGPSLERCAGGRLIVPGYVCPHCPSESPRTRCEKPARKRPTPSHPAEAGGP